MAHESATQKWWGDRPVYTFPVPAKYQTAAKCKTVSMVPLTWDEEERVAAQGSTQLKVLNTLTRWGICMLDDRPVMQNGEEVQALFDCHPAFRTILTTAYGKVNSPEPEDIRDFLDGMTVKV